MQISKSRTRELLRKKRTYSAGSGGRRGTAHQRDCWCRHHRLLLLRPFRNPRTPLDGRATSSPTGREARGNSASASGCGAARSCCTSRGAIGTFIVPIAPDTFHTCIQAWDVSTAGSLPLGKHFPRPTLVVVVVLEVGGQRRDRQQGSGLRGRGDERGDKRRDEGGGWSIVATPIGRTTRRSEKILSRVSHARTQERRRDDDEERKTAQRGTTRQTRRVARGIASAPQQGRGSNPSKTRRRHMSRDEFLRCKNEQERRNHAAGHCCRTQGKERLTRRRCILTTKYAILI